MTWDSIVYGLGWVTIIYLGYTCLVVHHYPPATLLRWGIAIAAALYLTLRAVAGVPPLEWDKIVYATGWLFVTYWAWVAAVLLCCFCLGIRHLPPAALFRVGLLPAIIVFVLYLTLWGKP